MCSRHTMEHLKLSCVLQVAEPKELLTCLQHLIVDYEVPMEKALPLFTENPARRLNFHNKGKVMLLRAHQTYNIKYM